MQSVGLRGSDAVLSPDHAPRRVSATTIDRLLAVLLLLLAILSPVDVSAYRGLDVRPLGVTSTAGGIKPFIPSASMAEMVDDVSDGEHALREVRLIADPKAAPSVQQIGAISFRSLRPWLPERPPRTA